MRICLVYDCLYPHTIGGAERWYRNLGERLAEAGHDVTYLTRRQWPRGADPGVPGVDVIAVIGEMSLYTPGGRRKITPPIVFGLGVLWHLLRHGRRYDIVHTAAFPYFSVIAAAAARRSGRYSLFVDWHEVWTRAYWEEYLGTAKGLVGWAVQKLCLKIRQRPFCFAQMTARRCHEEGLRDPVTVLSGLYTGTHELSDVTESQPLVMFAGRHIPEKRVPDLVPAIERARERLPDLRCVIFGDGPERAKVEAMVAGHGLNDVIEVPGFVDGERIDETMSRALCMVLPSRREGYGMVVVEAASWGTPSIVVDDPDNAATELVADGENGIVAASTSAEDLASAILQIHDEGMALRRSTAAWFQRNAPRVALSRSVEQVAEIYARRP
ncbi:glycosyltransferase family 4 protein [Capillimicrobium parvum]|uniref:D-inositol-3-phosphate glycosyltransferase n=1 Tax=Capillimicrobium parvum TaxID=2884022 RepID=A0A9E7C2S9_9ACTN|nr:glycosyltransferase [Capillimicrobium parvum]UGS38761.1 D-inositol-3-phosphate glycosyltransferase [Capillimicrobium parvum]